MELVIEKLTVGILEENCYIVFEDSKSATSDDSKKKNAVIIDPGDDKECIIKTIEKNNLHIEAILLTHAHFDHISALDKLQSLYKSKIYLNEGDFELYYSTEKQASFFNIPSFTVPTITDKCTENTSITHLNSTINVIHTPGHTKGSVCYYFVEQKALFTGDTLFKNSIGRVDLPTGNKDDMLESLKKLLNLPSDTTIYPGHMNSSTISEEKLNNPYLSNKFFF